MTSAGQNASPGPVRVNDLVVRAHHTAVSVQDFDAARSFFTDVIGMRLEGEMDHRREENLGPVTGTGDPTIRWAMLELNGYRLELFHYYEPQGERPHIRQCDVGLTHLCFEVYDADLAHARLTGAGYRTLSPPLELRGGRSKAFYCEGPEGIVVEFLELRPWRGG